MVSLSTPAVEPLSALWRAGYGLTLVWGSATGWPADVAMTVGTLDPRTPEIAVDDQGGQVASWTYTAAEISPLMALHAVRMTVTVGTGEATRPIGDGWIQQATAGRGDLQQVGAVTRYVLGVAGPEGPPGDAGVLRPISADTTPPAGSDGELCGYENVGAVAVTVAGITLAPGAYVILRWKDGAWGQLGGATAPAPLPTPTVDVTGQTSATVTVIFATSASATEWRYRLDGGLPAAMPGASPATITGLASQHSGTVEVAYSQDAGATWSTWSIAAQYATDAPPATFVRFNSVANNIGNWADNAFTTYAVWASENGRLPKTSAETYTTTAPDGSWTYLEFATSQPVMDKPAAANSGGWLWTCANAARATPLKLQGDGSIILPFSGHTWQCTGAQSRMGFTATTAFDLFRNEATGVYGCYSGAAPLAPGWTDGTITVDAGGITAGAADWIRATRSGTTLMFHVSKDAGVTWARVGIDTNFTTTPAQFNIRSFAFTLTKPTITGTWAP